MMPELTFGSLFAGIGGFDLGFERAGMKCAWQVEIDDFCQKVLEKHWPGVDRHGDIRECGRHNLEPVDVIAGGFPCQPHSMAGKRRGKADDRNLWPEYLRLVREIRPRWVVGENVPGLISTMLDEVLSDLEGEAYTVGTLVVPAVAFDAPHRRDRVFIVADAERGRLQQGAGSAGQAGQRWPESGGSGEDVADSPGRGEQPGSSRRNVRGLQNEVLQAGGNTNYWAPEPDVGRVAHGVPSRVDRLRALGNAVVPQVAEWIGRQIVEVEATR